MEGDKLSIAMQKITMVKAYLKEKGELHKFPKDLEFWHKFINMIDFKLLTEGE